MGNQHKKTYSSTSSVSTKTKGILILVGIIGLIFFFAAMATEDYSSGERIGFVTKFSRKGRFWKSWEGELNLTQTGMNTSSLFDFSIDNDKEDKRIIETIDSAVNFGWKIKVMYHQVYAKNWFSNRGETDYFVSDVKVLDKTGLGSLKSGDEKTIDGRVVDTVYVVIDKAELVAKMKAKKGLK